MSNNYKELFDSLNRNDTKYLDELVDLIRRILFERESFVRNSDNNELREEFFVLLKDKISELYNEHGSIDFIGEGHTSLAFQVGDSVLKIGKNSSRSRLDKVRDIPCLIPVLYDKDFKIGDREYYSIQLSPLVDTSDIVEEDIYGLYKDLRGYGYIWNDPTLANSGRIISDFDFNGHHYKKGDLVIIDLEDLAYVGEFVSDEVLDEIGITSYNPKVYTYEVNYMKEKGRTI